MRVLNSITRQDVTTFYLQLMKGEITNAEFEEIAGVTKKINTRSIRSKIDNIIE